MLSLQKNIDKYVMIWYNTPAIIFKGEKQLKNTKLKSYFLMTVGAFIMACGIYFFKFPNNFSTGGVSALSILLVSLDFGISASQYMMIFNVLLLIVGFAVFGRNFAFKTVYCSLLLSLFSILLEKVFPMSSPFTDQKMLELIFAIGLTAVGSAMLFNENASSGGTDIVAMILKKYTKMNIGNALLVSDFLLALASAFIFGIETGLFSILGLIMKAFVVDNVIDSINLTKCFFIVTEHDEEICRYITEELHRGATVSMAKGVFTGDDKKMIVTAMGRGQAMLLKRKIKETDKKAFCIITSTSDILGKGFRTVL